MPRKTNVTAAAAGRGALASMRPRPDAAENSLRRPGSGRGAHASMRPRPDAAENSQVMTDRTSTAGRFNEAAARCRGKLPRPGRASTPASGRFNEAAARCRGKPRSRA